MKFKQIQPKQKKQKEKLRGVKLTAARLLKRRSRFVRLKNKRVRKVYIQRRVRYARGTSERLSIDAIQGRAVEYSSEELDSINLPDYEKKTAKVFRSHKVINLIYKPALRKDGSIVTTQLETEQPDSILTTQKPIKHKIQYIHRGRRHFKRAVSITENFVKKLNWLIKWHLQEVDFADYNDTFDEFNNIADFQTIPGQKDHYRTHLVPLFEENNNRSLYIDQQLSDSIYPYLFLYLKPWIYSNYQIYRMNLLRNLMINTYRIYRILRRRPSHGQTTWGHANTARRCNIWIREMADDIRDEYKEYIKLKSEQSKRSGSGRRFKKAKKNKPKKWTKIKKKSDRRVSKFKKKSPWA